MKPEIPHLLCTECIYCDAGASFLNLVWSTDSQHFTPYFFLVGARFTLISSNTPHLPPEQTKSLTAIIGALSP